MDGPNAAQSGHQGTAMALAPLAHVLFSRVMSYDASDPSWSNRDRFVLSAGHASILQYAMLYLCGFGLELEDLRQFRQLGSRTPGHPEVHHTTGVEVTTGPLGQGVGNAVGMAMAQANLQARFGDHVCNHMTWCIAGDGDLSEGISHEAASLAGHLGLDNLVVIYDDNHISIDGPTELALSDSAPARFASYGWNVIEAGEIAEDLDALERVLTEAKQHRGAPTLVVVRSHIAFPSPKLTDSPAAHGLAFDAAEISATKALLGLPDEPFSVSDDVLAFYRSAGVRHAGERERWHNELAEALGDRLGDWRVAGGEDATHAWEEFLPSFEVGASIATRSALSKTLTALAPHCPQLLAGSADLTGNTGVAVGSFEAMSPDHLAGRQVHYGIREHAMGAVMNGMALHGGVYPVGGTFLVFSDYMRPAVRLAALMKTNLMFAWSHDSVGVGEDGPTHQPVEHLAALRAIPGLDVIRPCDANETAYATQLALRSNGPTAMIMSRQNLPVLAGTSLEGVERGGYVLVENEDADLTLVATGSEVSLALTAADVLAEHDVVARVVSLPSWSRFAAQDDVYRESVIPQDILALSIEAATTFGWMRWVDDAVGIDQFGTSAPGDLALEELGINAAHVVERALALLGEQGE